jgi:tetratricopeptide (TPR) repeat protein
LGHIREAIYCFDKALEINSNDVHIWLKKALIEDEFNLKNDAICSYKMFLKLASAKEYASEINGTRQRLQELEHSMPL